MRKKKKPIPLSSRSQVFFQDFYEAHKDFLLYTVCRYADEPQQQEDLFQDTLVRLLKNAEILQQLNPGQTAKYIALTVKTAYLDIERRRCEEKLILLDEAALEARLQRTETREISETVAALRSDMSARDWTVLEGKYIMGYSDEELSAVLGIAPDSIRSLLSRAKKRARKILGEIDREGEA